MKALISLAILISFLFSNSSCAPCTGVKADKKEECKDLTVESGQHCCFMTRENTETKVKNHQCLFFTQEQINDKENTMNGMVSGNEKVIDIDCDLSSSGGNTGNEKDGNTGNKEEERTRDNSSSKSIYLYESVLILLLLLIL